MYTDRQTVVREDQSNCVPSLVRGHLSKISLAVLLAVPALGVSSSYADNLPLKPQATSVYLVAVQDNPSTPPLLSAAIEQYKQGKYEESLVALQSIKVDALSETDRKTLNDTTVLAEEAVRNRRSARSEFEKGEAALAAGNSSEAASSYNSVIANKFADEGTRKKAAEQLAVATSGSARPAVAAGGVENDQKAVYNSAVADYNAGQYASARTKFTQLQDSGYKAAFLSKTPREYLELIDKQQTPTSSAEEARAAYLSGRDQYRKGDWIAARQNFNKSIDMGYKPGWFEESPSNYLAIMDKKENADAANAPREAVAVAPVVTSVDTTATPSVGGTDATVVAPSVDTSVTPSSDAAALANLAKENEAKIAQAKETVVAAKAAEDAQNLNQAAKLYSDAVALDPTNVDAIAGKNRVLPATGLAPVTRDLMTVREEQILAGRQAINFQFEQALTQATADAAAGKFDAAVTDINQAEVASKSNPGLFKNEELQNFTQRIADARVQVEQARLGDAVAQKAIAEKQALEEEKRRAAEAASAKERTIATLIADSRRLDAQGKYDEELKTLNQILSIDGRNQYANDHKQIVSDKASLQYQRRAREQFADELNKTFNEVAEKKIPYSGVLNYPANWPDLSEKRDKTVRDERAITDADNQAQGQLEKALPEIRFQDVAFSDVVDFLRDTTQANIFVNWKALEAAGIDRNAPVSTRLRNVKFSKVLRTILESVGGGATSQLSYTVDEGVITISTIEDLARNVETRTYDIRDLIISIPDFQAPTNTNDSNDTGTDITAGGDQGGGGAGGGGSLFGGGGGGDDANNDQNQTRTDLVDQITSLIRETIGVGTWKEDGGQLGTLRELSGQLVVTQTPEVHHAIQQLLEKLREQRSIQVTIETRFLSVQKNFLEDVGVDFDFFVNNDQNPFSGLVPGTGPLPIGSDGANQTGFGPINVTNSSADFTGANTLATGVSGNLAASFANPVMSTTINAFLDDFQASILIRASQGNQNVTNLTAPRLTLFNGQSATINVDRVVSYVSRLEPVVAQGAVGFRTTISRLTPGITLAVTATVSADRKYVTLTLQPNLTRLNGIINFPVVGVAANTGNGGGGAQTVSGFVQLPDVSRQRVRTSVSVPDGGTLLLGGATITGEIEREAGVPVLSKIPFLKRAFTNRSSATDENILLILVKPTIIIQREIEQDTFPLLTSRASGG